MNIDQIEHNIISLAQSINREEFIFDLLLAYGIPKATITLLKKGKHNLSNQVGRIILKRKVFFQEEIDTDIHESIDNLQKDILTSRYSPRFIVVTDYTTLLAADLKTGEHLDIPIKNISRHFDFFLPWAGIEKHRLGNENPADRKAAEKMAKLYDEILVENTIKEPRKLHDLNVFLSRLLFCFFAEDTNIFENKLFTNSIASHTQEDGSDLGDYLDKLFKVLNSSERSDFPQYLQRFPYVNGGLFATKHWIPSFTTRSRKIIIECGELNWSQINPDIFGSMMQAVVHPGERETLGMHYTSVPNIMKVIEPLFLDELREEFELYKENKKKLQSLLNRISRIKFFDPACGSGNFLIITYKELRRLEIQIIKQLGIFSFSSIPLSNFFGIEIDDFAHEIAKLSLYLAEHQMNIEFKDELSNVNPTLPLRSSGNIKNENALRIEWNDVCPIESNEEVFVLGNPPYLGGKTQSDEQKIDMQICFQGTINYKELDYIACWFVKASKYINQISKFSFVTTSSVCEGSQVMQLWPIVFGLNKEIYFAYKPFNWSNNAKRNAGVTCSIIGIRNIQTGEKYIYSEDNKQLVNNINGYLINARDMYVEKSQVSISKLPQMITGNSPYEGGNLVLSPYEKTELLKKYPESEILYRRVYGSDEFINGVERWCIWISDNNLNLAINVPPIAERILKTKEFRLKGGDVARSIAFRSHQFRYIHEAKISQIIIPIVSSSRREYIPIGFLPNNSIILSSAAAIYDPPIYIFGILSSKIHQLWARLTSGKLRGDIRYLSALCYNTFPFPVISENQKNEISRYVYNILQEREVYSENTIAQLYDPDKMPLGLKEAHMSLDNFIERCYRSKAFSSDEERLQYLFKLYEQMIKEEKSKNKN